MASNPPNHILYHNLYSICSIQVRYAYALRGQAKDEAHQITMQEEPIDLFKKEQLTEHYLCEVNPNGEVPVIAPKNSKPIPDSIVITKYLAGSYPSLIPDARKDDINRLLSELHGINFFSLTYTGKPFMAQGSIDTLEKLLKDDISDRYREAIKYKIQRIDNNKLSGLTDQAVKSNEDKTLRLMGEFDKIIQDSPTGWCFGLGQPSAIDAHLLVFIARMLDVGRESLITDTLKNYASVAMSQPEWHSVMQGRRTMASNVKE